MARKGIIICLNVMDDVIKSKINQNETSALDLMLRFALRDYVMLRNPVSHFPLFPGISHLFLKFFHYLSYRFLPGLTLHCRSLSTHSPPPPDISLSSYGAYASTICSRLADSIYVQRQAPSCGQIKPCILTCLLKSLFGHGNCS